MVNHWQHWKHFDNQLAKIQSVLPMRNIEHGPWLEWIQWLFSPVKFPSAMRLFWHPIDTNKNTFQSLRIFSNFNCSQMKSPKVKSAGIDKILISNDDFLSESWMVCVFLILIIFRSSSIERLFLVEEILDGLPHWPYNELFMFETLDHYKNTKRNFMFETCLSLYSFIVCFGVRAISHETVTEIL